MKCVKCRKEARVHMDTFDACDSCFRKIIERRVRKEIRLNRLIEKNDNIMVIDDGTAEAKLGLYLLKKITGNLPLKILATRKKYALGEEIKGSFNKVIIPWDADKEGEYLLGCFLENKKPRYLSHFRLKNKHYVKLLAHVMHKEAAEFCRISRIKFTDKKTTSLASEMIDKLQKDFPEITFSLVKSSEELKKII